MMKKLLSLLLVAAMALSMAFVMTSCGGDVENASSQGADTSILPEALKNITTYDIPDLANTGWQLAGGIIDGVEMEQEDLNDILTAAGGKLEMVFLGEGKSQLINGEQTLEGTYETTNNNTMLHTVYNGYEYYAVYSKVGEQTLLILANTTTPGTALYMIPIDEK